MLYGGKLHLGSSFREPEKFKFCTFSERLSLHGTFSKRLLLAKLHQSSTTLVVLVDAGREVTKPPDAGVCKVYWWVMVEVGTSPSLLINSCLSEYAVLYSDCDLGVAPGVYIHHISGALLACVWFYGGITNSFAKYTPERIS